MSTKTLSLLLAVCLCLFSTCKKEDSIVIDDPVITTPDENFNPPPPPVFINGSVTGTVVDENGEPLEGVNITTNTINTATDQNGVFILKDISLDQHGALVTAEKDGYYYNAKTIRPESGLMVYTKMMLLEKMLSGSISSSTGGIVSTTDNATIEISPNSVIDADGNAYVGNVNVYATWLDPTGEDLMLEMPGDLRGVNTGNGQVQLTTFGMIGVELEGDGGEPLPNSIRTNLRRLNYPFPTNC